MQPHFPTGLHGSIDKQWDLCMRWCMTLLRQPPTLIGDVDAALEGPPRPLAGVPVLQCQPLLGTVELCILSRQPKLLIVSQLTRLLSLGNTGNKLQVSLQTSTDPNSHGSLTFLRTTSTPQDIDNTLAFAARWARRW